MLALSKLMGPYPVTSGSMKISHEAMLSLDLRCVTTPMSWSMSCGRELSASGSPLSVLDTLTPIIISAPIARHISTGKLLSIPPSTSTILPILTGENTPGIAMLALMALDR